MNSSLEMVKLLTSKKVLKLNYRSLGVYPEKKVKQWKASSKKICIFFLFQFFEHLTLVSLIYIFIWQFALIVKAFSRVNVATYIQTAMPYWKSSQFVQCMLWFYSIGWFQAPSEQIFVVGSGILHCRSSTDRKSNVVAWGKMLFIYSPLFLSLLCEPWDSSSGGGEGGGLDLLFW